LEIGCGSGGNLLRFVRLGFRAENLVGSEILEDRLQEAADTVPSAIRLILGDATTLALADESFDIVCLFTVFSSILDDAFQEQLADKAWSLVKPGGGVLWYDFVYNNPANPDVRGVPVRRVRQLFPKATHEIRRITLAPPVGRIVTQWWDGSYGLLNRIPGLRTHALAWISKAGTAPESIMELSRFQEA
jgi:ubiquinone/menaquinone biosynthesis C-methylase UbiE